jgi:hypothetical protein
MAAFREVNLMASIPVDCGTLSNWPDTLIDDESFAVKRLSFPAVGRCWD